MTFLDTARKVSQAVGAALQQTIPVGEVYELGADAWVHFPGYFAETVPAWQDTEVLP